MPFRLLCLLSAIFFLSTCSSEPTPEVATTEGNGSFSSFDGETIAYHQTGDGPAVVMLHGFINDGSAWRGTELYRQLVGSGYRVIVPDLRGNGNSYKPHTDEAYADNAEIKDLIKLVDHLGLESWRTQSPLVLI